jgi:hypothetical protein
MQQLISIDAYDHYVGQPLGALPNDLVKMAHHAKYRPMVKAVLYNGMNSSHHPVATYRSAPARAKRLRIFNLPGGGIDYQSTWLHGLAQEFEEELPEFDFRLKDLKEAPILSVAKLETTRPNFRAKVAVLVGIMLPPERFGKGRLRPDGKELSDLVIHESIGSAAMRLAELPDTRPDAKAWYQSGFSKLRELLNT